MIGHQAVWNIGEAVKKKLERKNQKEITIHALVACSVLDTNHRLEVVCCLAYFVLLATDTITVSSYDTYTVLCKVRSTHPKVFLWRMFPHCTANVSGYCPSKRLQLLACVVV